MAEDSAMDPNLEERANWLSKLFFWWIQGIITKGYKAPLQKSDVFACHSELESKYLTDKLRVEWEREKTRKTPSITRALIRANSGTITAIVTMSVLEIVFLILPTIFVSKVSAYFDPESGVTFREAIMFGSLLIATNFVYCFQRSILFWMCHRLGPILRTQTSSLVYDKSTKISFAALSKTSVGHVITLVTNDSERFNDGVIFFKSSIGIPLTIIATFILSYYYIGLISTITAYTAILIVLPAQYFMGHGVARSRKRAAPHTDKRIKLIGEMIASMKVIKMYRWESVFSDAILKIRKLESKYVGFFVLMRCMNMVIPLITPIFALLVLLVTKYFTEEKVSSEMVFFFIALSEILRKTVNMGIGAMFLNIPQFRHSLKRIQRFLELEERVEEDLKRKSVENGDGVVVNHSVDKGTVVQFDNSKNGEVEKKDRNGSLDNVIIVNPILEANGAKIDGNGCIVIDDTKKDHSEDKGSQDLVKEKLAEKYATEMLKMDNLTSTWGGEHRFILSDINISLKEGSLTGVVGPVGSGKSSIIMTIIREMEFVKGTMKCPYTIGFYNQVPWIFNGSVEENILFNRPLNRERLQKTIDACYLTRDLEQLPHGLNTIVGERGVQLSGGQRARVSLARVVYGDEDIVLLDDPLSAVDTKCANHIFQRLIKEYLSDKTVLLVTHNSKFLPELDYIYMMSSPEKKGDEIVGRISNQGTFAELLKEGVIEDPATADKKDDVSADDTDQDGKTSPPNKKKGEVVKEDRKTGLIDKSVYQRFWSLAYGPLTLAMCLLGVVIVQGLKIFQERQALTWVEHGGKDHFTFYSLMAAATIVLHISSDLFIAYTVTRCSRALHNMAFSGVMNSPMRFFDTTPVGIVINRFAKDTMQCDERIAMAFTFFCNIFINFLASMIILCIANYYTVLILLPLLSLMTVVLFVYLKSSVEVRRLEAMERSPVMSHINSTLTGMSTIRASRQVGVFIRHYYALRDRHTSTEMIFKAIERWLSLRLDLIVTLIGFLATITCIYLKDVVGPELAGLGMVYVQTKLGAFQYCIRQGAETENLMTAVERIFALADLPAEPDPNKGVPDKRPSRAGPTEQTGVVKFDGVQLRYADNLPYVLRNVSFTTQPNEKIGVVGRTGAGKSSLIQALYRMCEVEGSISINGVDTSSQSLADLRSSISVIPQESLLFSGSLRDNLDPYLKFNDDVLWDILEQVQLKTYITGKGGLLMTVEEMGCNLSVGQRQLLCLARALLKQTSLLVVDEATANVDQATDAAIQTTIRSCFKDRTVITIAHRLNTIIDSDRIMVMDEGKIVEFDTPDNLLNETSSYFYSLVNQSKV